jgi:hypothetical protein
MDKTEARTLAEKMMTEHGLIEAGWTFAFDGAERRMGVCRYGVRRIQMSRHYVSAATSEQVGQTMLHEIAHALLPATVGGKSVGHGNLWKAKAASIGYTGKRTAENPYMDERRERMAASMDLPPVTRVYGARHQVGSTVTIIGGQQRLRGMKATVLATNRTRYRIQTAAGEILLAPFSLVA